MKVFIENEAGNDQKNIFDEKTLEFKRAVTVSRKYPYPYGFILETTGDDGDNVDVFVITDKKLKKGQIINCEPIGLMEQIEKTWNPNKNDEEIDHNVIAVLRGGDKNVLSGEIKENLTDFVLHVFDHIQKDKNRVGDFLDREAAWKYINSCKDNIANI